MIASDEISQVAVEIQPDIALEDECALSVTEYNDAQELLLADPIHEVKEESGWSPHKDALNPNQEDVDRRESKMEE